LDWPFDEHISVLLSSIRLKGIPDTDVTLVNDDDITNDDEDGDEDDGGTVIDAWCCNSTEDATGAAAGVVTVLSADAFDSASIVDALSCDFVSVAHVKPAGPPPTTSTSKFCFLLMIFRITNRQLESHSLEIRAHRHLQGNKNLDTYR
jgi:hypothetical protein